MGVEVHFKYYGILPHANLSEVRLTSLHLILPTVNLEIFDECLRLTNSTNCLKSLTFLVVNLLVHCMHCVDQISYSLKFPVIKRSMLGNHQVIRRVTLQVYSTYEWCKTLSYISALQWWAVVPAHTVPCCTMLCLAVPYCTILYHATAQRTRTLECLFQGLHFPGCQKSCSLTQQSWYFCNRAVPTTTLYWPMPFLSFSLLSAPAKGMRVPKILRHTRSAWRRSCWKSRSVERTTWRKRSWRSERRWLGEMRPGASEEFNGTDYR